MILNKQEKEQLVLKLAMENKNYRTISQIAHVSFVDIGKIIRKYNNEELEYKNPDPSITSKTFQMFKEGRKRVDVAIALNLEASDVIDLFYDYLKLSNLDGLVATHEYLGDDLATFLDLFYKMREEGIVTQSAIVRFVQSAGKLARLEEESLKLCDQIGRLNDKKVELRREVESATSLLSYLRTECSKLE